MAAFSSMHALAFTLTTGCGGSDTRRVVTPTVPAVSSAVVASVPPPSPWEPPAHCTPTKPESRTLDALVAASAPRREAVRASSAIVHALGTLVVPIPDRAWKPLMDLDVGGSPTGCRYANALVELPPDQAALVREYLGERQAGRPGVTLRRKAIAVLDAASDKSVAAAFAGALLLDEELRSVDLDGIDAARALVEPWARVKERTQPDSFRGAWARLALVEALSDLGDTARAHAELDEIAMRSLAWADFHALFEIGRRAASLGEEARALAAFQAARAAPENLDLAMAASWNALLAATSLHRASDVLAIASEMLATRGSGFEIDLRTRAADAVVALGVSELVRLDALPKDEEATVASLASEIAEDEELFGLAAAAAARAGDTKRAAQLRARRPAVATHREPSPTADEVEQIVWSCFSHERHSFDLDVTIVVLPGGIADAIVAPPEHAECIAAEARRQLHAPRRSVRAKVLVRP